MLLGRQRRQQAWSQWHDRARGPRRLKASSGEDDGDLHRRHPQPGFPFSTFASSKCTPHWLPSDSSSVVSSPGRSSWPQKRPEIASARSDFPDAAIPIPPCGSTSLLLKLRLRCGNRQRRDHFSPYSKGPPGQMPFRRSRHCSTSVYVISSPG